MTKTCNCNGKHKVFCSYKCIDVILHWHSLVHVCMQITSTVEYWRNFHFNDFLQLGNKCGIILECGCLTMTKKIRHHPFVQVDQLFPYLFTGLVLTLVNPELFHYNRLLYVSFWITVPQYRGLYCTVTWHINSVIYEGRGITLLIMHEVSLNRPAKGAVIYVSIKWV